jgi:hypothetical protein
MPLFQPDMHQPYTAYSPTITCSGAMEINGGGSVDLARYKHVGTTFFLELAISGTLETAQAAAVYVTLPSGIASKSGQAAFVPAGAVNGAGQAVPGCVALIQNAGQGAKVSFYTNTIAANWTLGAAFSASIIVAFEVE